MEENNNDVGRPPYEKTNEDTKMKLAGEQYRNILEFYRTSIPFMKLYDYFNPEKKGE